MMVAVHDLKFETGNLKEMKRVYDLDIYKPAKALEEKHEGRISNFYFPFSTFREHL